MSKCLYCGKPIEEKTEEISDGCCSDLCWEAFYAPGPQEEAILEFDKIEIFN